MHIREFTYTSDDYDALMNIISIAWDVNSINKAVLIRADQQRNPRYIRRRFFAEVDQQVVAYATVEHRPNMYHPQRFWINLAVLPSRRRQGIGTELFKYLQSLLQLSYNANELHATVPPKYEDSIPFFHKFGFQEVKHQWESHLDTTLFDGAPFGDIPRQIAATGIQITPLSDLLHSDPDTLHRVYQLHQTIVQDVAAPAPRTQVDFEDWQHGYSIDNPNFLPEANLIARHDNNYVGMTGLWGKPSSGRLYTGLTGVLRDYRCRKIATALKLHSITYAQAHHILQLITYNKGGNPMLQLNLKLGFVKQCAEIMMMKRL